MKAKLIYYPRQSALAATLPGKSFRLATAPQRGNLEMNSWLEAAQAGMMNHRPVKHGLNGGALTIAENAKVLIQDQAGAATGRGVLPEHRGRRSIIWIDTKGEGGGQGDGFHLHGPPHCGCPRCIVVIQDWEGLFAALKSARQTTLAVEV